MFIGGTLIKQFDGFRRLCRHAATDHHYPLTVPDGDMMLVNRILASIGGPPAPREVKGHFEGDGLPLLLLFLLTQGLPCRIGLVGNADRTMGRLKSMAHLLGQAAYPTLSGRAPLDFQEVVKELGPSGALLKPCFHYDTDGEPITLEPTGSAGVLRVGAEGGPYTLMVMLGPSPGPALLESGAGPLYPAVAILS